MHNRSLRGRWFVPFIPLLTICLKAPAANYRAIDLTPPGQSATILGAHNGKAFGMLNFGLIGHAAEWEVDSGTFTSYHGPPYEESYLYGGAGNVRVGYTIDRDILGGRVRATGWENKVPRDFSPLPDLFLSGMYATDGNQHVGNASLDFGTNGQAIVWNNNNPREWWDLTPRQMGFHSAIAKAVHNGKQGGLAWGDGVHVHAILWRGTAGTAVDLHPASGPWTWSQLNDIHNNEQVGFASTNALFFNDAHAYIWNNTAASARDVHPLGAIRSALNGTNGIFQVGYARPAGSTVDHAFVWAGTAESAVDLHSLLPPELVSSVAMKIDQRGYIYGNAKDAAGLSRAVVWIPVPEPAAIFPLIAVCLLLRARLRALH